MPSPSLATERVWRQLLPALCCLLVVSLAEKFQLSDGVLRDPFHQGEYFAGLATLLSDHADILPLTVHGALDYLPGLLALKLFGPQAHFFPTLLAYQLLDLTAAILLLMVTFELLGNRPGNSLLLLATVIAAPLLVMDKDVLLLASIYLYFLSQRHDGGERRLLEVLLGVALACGVFWSYDRGIAGAVSVGTACLIQAWGDRRYLTTLVVFPMVALALGRLWPAFGPENYFFSISVLAETAAQWSYGWEAGAVIRTAFLGWSTLMALWLLVASVAARGFAVGRVANAALFGCLCLFLFKMGTNRADLWHLLGALWGPMLVGVHWYSGYSEQVAEHSNKAGLVSKAALFVFFCFLAVLGFLYPLAAFIAIGVIVAIAAASTNQASAVDRWPQILCAAALAVCGFVEVNSIANGISAGRYAWTEHLGSLPANSMLVGEDVRWVAQELTRAGARCVFDLSNHGLINGLTGLPACSRFTYPVYADQRYEQELVEAVNSRAPQAIVFSSTDWSYSIDGKPMSARFPHLTQVLREEYGSEKCAFGQCIRYRGGAE